MLKGNGERRGWGAPLRRSAVKDVTDVLNYVAAPQYVIVKNFDQTFCACWSEHLEHICSEQIFHVAILVRLVTVQPLSTVHRATRILSWALSASRVTCILTCPPGIAADSSRRCCASRLRRCRYECLNKLRTSSQGTVFPFVVA